MSRATVSAVFSTKNVGGFVGPTLDSLAFCDEVIVVDMFSTDNTREVCESYPNVRFFQRNDFIYGNFNHGVEQSTGDWIIRIDSDEVLSPELQKSILDVLNDPNPQFTNYEAIMHLYKFGMRVKGLDGNKWRTTLYRKGTAYYKVQIEHEDLTVTGPTGRLAGQYDHFSVPTISSSVAKYNYYTDQDTLRNPIQKPKNRWKVLIDAARYFRYAYFGKGRLRHDGYLGFTVALLATYNQILYDLKSWEIYERDQRAKQGTLSTHPNMAHPRDKIATR